MDKLERRITFSFVLSLNAEADPGLSLLPSRPFLKSLSSLNHIVPLRLDQTSHISGRIIKLN